MLMFSTLQSQDHQIFINKITLFGNRVTKDKIIKRELEFKEGDTLYGQSQLLEVFNNSTNNLMNTELFNFVDIMHGFSSADSSHVDVVIQMVERWYIWPAPIFQIADRNINSWLSRDDKFKRLNYGLWLTWNNFRGLREQVILYVRPGYEQMYELSYLIPNINKKQSWGIGFGGGIIQNRQIAVNSIDNNESFYPLETRKDEYPKREYYGFAQATHRKNIYTTHTFNGGYKKIILSDSVLLLNPAYAFDQHKTNAYFFLDYMLKFDYRDYKHYALKGFYFDLIATKQGLGILNNWESGSFWLQSNFRKFFELGERWHFASGITGKYSLIQNQPFYYQTGLGDMRDLVRGYEKYMVLGHHFALLKNNLKFTLLPTMKTDIRLIPMEQFSKIHLAIYTNLYADVGYVFNPYRPDLNPLSDKLLLGGGIGFDFVTYYDKVFRVEFSINREGEFGVFFHYIPSI